MIYIYLIGLIIAFPLWFYHELDDRYWKHDGFLNIFFMPLFWPISIPYLIYEKWNITKEIKKKEIRKIMES